ncbi:hypothetical protein CXF85_09375 [Colwellia sp. 75C3]|nr:hypothetical protein CXF85_09375 [Colwellia sp. 75C3]
MSTRSTLPLLKTLIIGFMLLHSLTVFSQSSVNEIGVYYLISADDRSGQGASATEAQLNQGIDQLNRDFKALNISFVLRDKIYLTNNDVAGIHDGKWDTNNEEQVREFLRYGSLNVVVANLDGKNGHAYWNYEATDMIEVEPEDLATSTISHEFGHNLGLLHTYQSIDDGPITLLEGDGGWQYGDKVIDTAVDPGERSYYNDCVYSASTVDSTGNAYHPDGFNIMGKGHNTCRNRFSAGQIKRIERVLLSDKFHLFNSFAAAKNPTCRDLAIHTAQGLQEGFNYNESPQNNSWRQDSYLDNFNWKYYNSTSTSSTGASKPQEGHTFLHIDASHELISANDRVNLISPCFRFEASSAAELSFYYSMYGSDTGSLSVQITQDNGGSWQTLWHKSGPQHQSGLSWSLATISLGQYKASPFQLRLSGQVIGGSKGDISIDNLRVTSEPSDIDEQVQEISFTEQLDVELDVAVYSEAVIITGINTNIKLSISNGEYSIGCIADAYNTDVIQVSEGDKLCLRHSSGNTYQKQVETILTLAQQEFIFSSTTMTELLVLPDPVIIPEPDVIPEAEITPALDPDPTPELAAIPDLVTDPVVISDSITMPVSKDSSDMTQEQQTSAGSMAITWLIFLMGILSVRRKLTIQVIPIRLVCVLVLHRGNKLGEGA